MREGRGALNKMLPTLWFLEPRQTACDTIMVATQANIVTSCFKAPPPMTQMLRRRMKYRYYSLTCDALHPPPGLCSPCLCEKKYMTTTQERCQGPPGGPSEWTAFDSAKLAASQRALSRAVDLLRHRAAAAEAAQAKCATGGVFDASRRPWLADSPEGLCAALRACVSSDPSGRGGGIGAQASGG